MSHLVNALVHSLKFLLLRMKLPTGAEIPEDVHDGHVQLVAHRHRRFLPAQVDLQIRELVKNDFFEALRVGEALQVVDKEAALLGPMFPFCCCNPSFSLLKESPAEVPRPTSKFRPSHGWK